MTARWAMLAIALLASVELRAADPRRGTDWRGAATANDRARLRRWRSAWVEALAQLRTRGEGARLAAEPALFDPDHALPDAAVPAGTYRCRLMRLGGAGAAILTQPWAPCTVERDEAATRFTIGGTQRATGRLYAGADARVVFLGTMTLGDERRVLRYGRDASRDMAGVVERIGAARWRLVLPYPSFGGPLDLVEIARP